MIRLVIGFFILLGAVGHEDFMAEQGLETSLGIFAAKALIGSALMLFGLMVMKRRGQLDYE